MEKVDAIEVLEAIQRIHPVHEVALGEVIKFINENVGDPQAPADDSEGGEI